MWMQVFSAHVIDGAIVPDEGVELPEGARLTVSTDDLAPDIDEMSDAEEAEWLESMAEAALGESAGGEERLSRLED